MRKTELTFGYAFLVLGVGLPYLIEHLSGSATAATAVSLVFVAAGLVLLVLGYRSRAEEKQRQALAKRPHLSLDVSPSKTGRYYGKWDFVLRNDSDDLAVDVVVQDINLPVPDAMKQRHRVAIAQALDREAMDADQPQWVVKFQMGIGDVSPRGGTKPVAYSVYGVGPSHGQDLAKAFESCSPDSDFMCEMEVDFSSVSGGRWRSSFGLTYHHVAKSISRWYIGTESL